MGIYTRILDMYLALQIIMELQMVSGCFFSVSF